MKKYGVEHFHIELVEETNNPDERECYWIEYFNSYSDGYNATRGGDGKRYYDHEQTLVRLQNQEYPCDIADKIGCSRDIVRELARAHNIPVKNKVNDILRSNSKPISAYTKQGKFVKHFASAADAARWCYEQNKCAAINSGVRSHICEAANGKRKSAYTYI